MALLSAMASARLEIVLTNNGKRQAKRRRFVLNLSVLNPPR